MSFFGPVSRVSSLMWAFGSPWVWRSLDSMWCRCMHGMWPNISRTLLGSVEIRPLTVWGWWVIWWWWRMLWNPGICQRPMAWPWVLLWCPGSPWHGLTDADRPCRRETHRWVSKALPLSFLEPKYLAFSSSLSVGANVYLVGFLAENNWLGWYGLSSLCALDIFLFKMSAPMYWHIENLTGTVLLILKAVLAFLIEKPLLESLDALLNLCNWFWWCSCVRPEISVTASLNKFYIKQTHKQRHTHPNISLFRSKSVLLRCISQNSAGVCFRICFHVGMGVVLRFPSRDEASMRPCGLNSAL